MPWNLELVESKFIKVNYLGEVTADELVQAFVAAFSKSNESGVLLFLADCSQMTGGHSNFDLFYLIGMFEKYEINKNMKEAILLPLINPDDENVKFYETSCLNRGYIVKLFNDYDKALQWLIAKP